MASIVNILYDDMLHIESINHVRHCAYTCCSFLSSFRHILATAVCQFRFTCSCPAYPNACYLCVARSFYAIIICRTMACTLWTSLTTSCTITTLSGSIRNTGIIAVYHVDWTAWFQQCLQSWQMTPTSLSLMKKSTLHTSKYRAVCSTLKLKCNSVFLLTAFTSSGVIPWLSVA